MSQFNNKHNDNKKQKTMKEVIADIDNTLKAFAQADDEIYGDKNEK